MYCMHYYRFAFMGEKWKWRQKEDVDVTCVVGWYELQFTKSKIKPAGAEYRSPKALLHRGE